MKCERCGLDREYVEVAGACAVHLEQNCIAALLAALEAEREARKESLVRAAALFDAQKRAIADVMDQRDAALARVKVCEEALRSFTEFAWSALMADCDEARDNVNGMVAKARAALKEGR